VLCLATVRGQISSCYRRNIFSLAPSSFQNLPITALVGTDTPNHFVGF
jgi:hypothetical protein